MLIFAAGEHAVLKYSGTHSSCDAAQRGDNKSSWGVIIDLIQLAVYGYALKRSSLEWKQ